MSVRNQIMMNKPCYYGRFCFSPHCMFIGIQIAYLAIQFIVFKRRSKGDTNYCNKLSACCGDFYRNVALEFYLSIFEFLFTSYIYTFLIN